jgi:hypothetical protein
MKATAGICRAAAEWTCSGALIEEETTMVRILITAIVAFSLAGAGTADAAAKKKKTREVAPAPTITAPVYPPYARTPGPLWANPNECYTDEGYGRYWPCGQGKE